MKRIVFLKGGCYYFCFFIILFRLIEINLNVLNIYNLIYVLIIVYLGMFKVTYIIFIIS